MIKYTVWKLSKFHNLEEFSEEMKKHVKYTETSGKARGEIELTREIYDDSTLTFASINSENIEGMDIRYIFFKTNVQTCKHIDDDANIFVPRDHEEQMIAFEDNNGYISLVVCAALTNAETMIKKIFKDEDIWGLVEPEEFIKEDMLYWLFYRLREKNEELILQTPVLSLNGIVSYLGRTEDNRNVVRGLGVRVSALLGTMGMLVGEENLRALRPMIQYGNHEMNIELMVGNSGRVYQQRYCGNLNLDFENNEKISTIRLLLFTCKFVLPALVSGYKNDIRSDEWSLRIKYDFLLTTGNEMIYKVKRQLQNTKQEIRMNDQLNGLEDEDEELDELDEELDS